VKTHAYIFSIGKAKKESQASGSKKAERKEPSLPKQMEASLATWEEPRIT
jgi:hypothetical protein